MAINTEGAAQTSLTVFGGTVTEQAAVDLPEGVSSDCQDVEFVPGSVFSRRGLQKLFAQGINGNVTITYSKTFVMPNGDVRNLFLDSVGNLWWNDVSNGGALQLLTIVTPGSYAKSITAFGREYIAIIDLLHGADVPLQWDGTFIDRVTQDGPGGAPTIANLVMPSVAGAGSPSATLVRTAGVVLATTAAAHGLQPGYLAQISGLSPQPVAYTTSIVINNEDSPGIATVETAVAHGLSAGLLVQIQSPPGVSVGGGISGITWAGGIAMATTAAAHGLSPGAQVTLAGTPDYDGTFTVAATPSVEVFTFIFTPVTAPPADTAGTVTLNWPVLDDGSDPTYFEVLSCPSTTTFQVQISYADGTWPGGGTGIFIPWDTTAFVSTVPSPTTFTYLSLGPDNNTGTDIGTITPTGQIAPGQHQMQVLFLTRQGYLTQPSPPVTFNANGGQYAQVTNIPIGPRNVVARVLAFTGAGGAYFFYIPTPPQANAQIVGTATQINDNTTTSVILDFSDNTLFSSLGISIPGNAPANQIVIDGALAFGYYADRLLTWGQRNRIQNLLNMGFAGGSFPSAITLPTGWKSTAAGGMLVARIINSAWSINLAGGPGTLQQSMYEDAYGVPIAQSNTQYTFRCFASAQGAGTATLTASISSASTGFSATALVTPVANASGQFYQADFSQMTPSVIPSDMLFIISGSGAGTLEIAELSVIYTANPYLDTILYGSYIDNPEGFDGVTGKFGASQDTRKVMDVGAIRETLYLLTQDPSGRLHQTSDNGTTEPSGWTVSQVAAECGLLSALGLTKSQADDSSAAGGEEWLAWASASGARIFGGDQPWKISQEIQPDWDAISTATPLLLGPSEQAPAYLTIWALNDPDGRMLYFGLPSRVPGTAITNPNRVYTMSYRELETAYQIGTSGPIHTSFTGRLIATDHTRKWTRWNMTMNGAALMQLNPASNAAGSGTPSLAIVLFGGNGAPPGLFPGFGNVYTLNPAKFTDDDYGLIQPYYTTYFFVSHDQEQQLSYQLPNGQRVALGAGRKLLQYLTAFIGAPVAQTNTQSVINLAFLCNSLTNQWPLAVSRKLPQNPTVDLECGGASAVGNRIAVKFYSTPANPAVSMDNGFNLQHLTLWLKAAAHLPIRGAQQAGL